MTVPLPRGLGRSFYTDPCVFDAELELIFGRHWLVACHVSELPEDHDTLVFECGSESVLLARIDGQLRGWLNVCPHRGARLCTTGGRRGAIICPYHGWVFGLDGELRHAPSTGPGFSAAKHGLQAVPLEIVEGVVLVCLSGNPNPLHPELRADAARFLGPYDLDTAQVGASWSREVQANWKIVLENFLECYHCGAVHAAYSEVMYGLRNFGQAMQRDPAWDERWDKLAKDLGHVTGGTPLTDDREHCCSRRPMREGQLSQARGCGLVAPVMGRLGAADGGITQMQLLPGGYVLGPCDYLVLFRFEPRAIDLTRVHLRWLVHGDAIPQMDFDQETLVWLWQTTFDEDAAVVEQVQLGVRSRRYQSGPLGPREHAVAIFNRWYRRQLEDVCAF
jgi:phenylpropionate dioxygenase-like ring-hydroxylating dioxygenase large terminal subunit